MFYHQTIPARQRILAACRELNTMLSIPQDGENALVISKKGRPFTVSNFYASDLRSDVGFYGEYHDLRGERRVIHLDEIDNDLAMLQRVLDVVTNVIAAEKKTYFKMRCEMFRAEVEFPDGSVRSVVGRIHKGDYPTDLFVPRGYIRYLVKGSRDANVPPKPTSLEAYIPPQECFGEFLTHHDLGIGRGPHEYHSLKVLNWEYYLA